MNTQHLRMLPADQLLAYLIKLATDIDEVRRQISFFPEEGSFLAAMYHEFEELESFYYFDR